MERPKGQICKSIPDQSPNACCDPEDCCHPFGTVLEDHPTHLDFRIEVRNVVDEDSELLKKRFKTFKSKLPEPEFEPKENDDIRKMFKKLQALHEKEERNRFREDGAAVSEPYVREKEQQEDKYYEEEKGFMGKMCNKIHRKVITAGKKKLSDKIRARKEEKNRMQQEDEARGFPRQKPSIPETVRLLFDFLKYKYKTCIIIFKSVVILAYVAVCGAVVGVFYSLF